MRSNNRLNALWLHRKTDKKFRYESLLTPGNQSPFLCVLSHTHALSSFHRSFDYHYRPVKPSNRWWRQASAVTLSGLAANDTFRLGGSMPLCSMRHAAFYRTPRPPGYPSYLASLHVSTASSRWCSPTSENNNKGRGKREWEGRANYEHHANEPDTTHALLKQKH